MDKFKFDYKLNSTQRLLNVREYVSKQENGGISLSLEYLTKLYDYVVFALEKEDTENKRYSKDKPMNENQRRKLELGRSELHVNPNDYKSEFEGDISNRTKTNEEIINIMNDSFNEDAIKNNSQMDVYREQYNAYNDLLEYLNKKSEYEESAYKRNFNEWIKFKLEEAGINNTPNNVYTSIRDDIKHMIKSCDKEVKIKSSTTECKTKISEKIDYSNKKSLKYVLRNLNYIIAKAYDGNDLSAVDIKVDIERAISKCKLTNKQITALNDYIKGLDMSLIDNKNLNCAIIKIYKKLN